MKTINRDELKEKLDHNEVKLVEVLDKEAYNKEHIKGAMNIPLERIGTEAKDRFAKDDQIVVYCSNFDCSASPTAAKKLDGLGFKNVYDYQGGKKDWKDAGLPME
ncbi:MAG TPA: rhodanese-like domain-containing protein [Bacteroidales bacterium]|nr:rhodanese-like domain-containing protein [Bacteroidales bacterium]